MKRSEASIASAISGFDMASSFFPSVSKRFAKYASQRSTRFISLTGLFLYFGSTLASIQHETRVNENPAYAVQVEHNLYITKNKSSADISVSLSKGGKEAAVIIKERRDRQRECPFKMKECLKQINQIISKEGINFINLAHIDNQEKIHLFNSFVFNLFVKFYQMKNEERYCYCYDVNKNPIYTYSQAAIDFILEQIKKALERIVQELKDKIKN